MHAPTTLPPRPAPDGGGLVDATGTRRRLHALVAVGWPLAALAAALNTDVRIVGRLIAPQATVQAPTARAVADLYDRLWDVDPVRVGAATARGAHWARRRAAARGWPVPMAWDDDTIDDPDGRPDTGHRPVRDGHDHLARRRAARVEDVLFLASVGVDREQIATRVGVSRDYTTQIIRRHGLQAAA